MKAQEIPAAKALKNFKAYTPGEQPPIWPAFQKKNKARHSKHSFIKLNTNENPFPPLPPILKALCDFPAHTLRYYPDPEMRLLRQSAAKALGLEPETIVFGNGSDELIAAIFRAYLDSRDSLALARPGYNAYKSYAALYNIAIHWLDLDEQFRLNAKLLSQCPAKICFIANPHAPSGVAMPSVECLRLVEENPKKLFIFDEAYADFSLDALYSHAPKHHNLIVMRTLSKSFSLAGLRLGYMIANPRNSRLVRSVLDPYNIDSLAAYIGERAFQNFPAVKLQCQKINAIRDAFALKIQNLGFHCYASSANFLLCQADESWQKLAKERKTQTSAEAVFQILKERNIYLRYFKEPRLNKALRISIGSEAEMQSLYECLLSIKPI